jgi:omega-6 fatty acid desaturase (delta-12 desaturase)
MLRASHRRTRQPLQNWNLHIVPQATAVAQTAPRSWDNKSQSELNIVDREAQKEQARRMAVHCAKYRTADNRRAFLQIVTTTVPFLAVVTAMFLTVETHYWLTWLLAIPGGLLLVRYFIIQHDCGHGSFTSSRKMNTWIGRAMSLLTVCPYDLWRREHAQHHATSGHLEKRGVGDIDTLTVKEFQALPALGKLRYKIYRHPFVLFGLGVPFYFMIIQRFPWFHPYPARETWKSILGLNAGLLVFYGVIGAFTGYSNLFFVVWPLVHVASATGGWLFFIQHQFEDTVWDDNDEWTFQVAALFGSSYYALHPVLNWFTGSIGMHHIHHLNSMIPNYRLSECLNASEDLKNLNRVTLWDSFRCAKLKLWDEDNRRLVTFAEARAL